MRAKKETHTASGEMMMKSIIATSEMGSEMKISTANQ